MAIRIKCPYCFETFNDNQVHFRSEYVLSGENVAEQADDFYRPTVDEAYERFWGKHRNIKTEEGTIRDESDIPEYMRRVIDPSDITHRKHLLQYDDGTYLIRDPQMNHMVTGIRICDGDKSCTSKRVCLYCHNPLPDGYGQYPTVFISMVGKTGVGKSTYLYQLLKNIDWYVNKCGFSLLGESPSIKRFLEHGMPKMTVEGTFQQPLMIDIGKRTEDGSYLAYTVVMYDVSGCIYSGDTIYELNNLAPFIRESDGIIFMMEPEQFMHMNDMEQDVNPEVPSARETLNSIHQILVRGAKKYEKPLAVVMSKTDCIQNEMPATIEEYISTDYAGIVRAGTKRYETIFGEQGHKKNEREIADFIFKNDLIFMQNLNNGYSNYNFFAASYAAKDSLEEHLHRIEEPFLWILCKLGVIGTDAFACPICHVRNVNRIPIKQIQRTKSITTGRAIHREENTTEDITVNCRCNLCGCEFMTEGN